ncbi:MAG: CGLD27 family protein [Pseudanabaena sp. ELA607]
MINLLKCHSTLTMSCPVPKEQQPLNEYVELKEAFFYRWAKLTRSQSSSG